MVAMNARPYRRRDSDGEELSLEEINQNLAAAAAKEVTGLADRILAAVEADGVELQVVRSPEVGAVVSQVREPLAKTRFILADVQVVQAEVDIAGYRGWAMRTGSDRQAALAAAVCEAEYLRLGPHSDRVVSLAARVRDGRERARADQWRRLVPTIVEFEEVL